MAEYCILQDVLALAKKPVPGLQFRLRFLPESEQVLRVLNYTSDVGFMGFFSPGVDLLVRYAALYREHAIVVIPSAHRLARKRSLRLSELSDEWWILPSRDQSPVIHDVFVAECHKAGFTPKINTSADWYSRFPLVASGAGVCLGASSLLHFRRPKIRFIPINPEISVELGMIMRIDDQMPQLDEFRAIVQRAVAQRRAGQYHLPTNEDGNDGHLASRLGE